ncbi:MAG: SLBB domain-containing protein [Betaproteobacteria bacterium]|nr:SLBB domain-containing protein [Betaproteobacteria bacterium]
MARCGARWLLALIVTLFAAGQAGAQLAPGAMFGAGSDPRDSSGASPGSTAPLLIPGTRTPAITNRLTRQPAPGALYPGSEAAREAARQFPSPAETQAEEKSEFQDFITVSTGTVLPLFGFNLFRDVPSTFSPVDDVPVTPDYVIGPGDELYIRGWGQIDIDYRTTVDRNGTISIPRVGVINVGGIKYSDLTAYVKTSVARVFRNFELTVSMGQLRSIQIFVVGQARRPGAYTVSSLSTLVNAAFAAGGPSKRGSMRAIQLKRGGKLVTELDLYELLVYGDKSKDAQLLPGDVIYFSPAGPLVALAGSVKTPAIYELKGDTTLAKLIEWSGGLATTAQLATATLERIEARRTRMVEKISLDDAGLAKPLKDGDLATVFPISPKFENAITLRGNVAVPLRYPFTPGMRIRDLIPEREALITRDYYLKKNLAIRPELDDEPRIPGASPDEARLRDEPPRREAFSGAPREDDARAREARRDGQSRDEPPRAAGEAADASRRREGRGEGQHPRTEVKNLMREINWQYAVIERLNYADLTTQLLPFNLGKAVLEGDVENNLALQPGDIVTVFSKDDIRVPVDKRTKFVHVEGEFVNAGVYQVPPDDTLVKLIRRIGGLSPNAYLFGAEFTRESTREEQRKNYEQTLNRLEREAELAAGERARNVVSAEDAASLSAQAASQKAVIARLRQVKPVGRIVLELPEDPKVDDLPDIAFEDGDRIYVPPQPLTVSVYGSVFTEASFLYRKDKGAADYLGQAGGPTSRADKSQMFVLRANGAVVGSQRGLFGAGLAIGRVMPGDTIVVPEDYDRTTFVKSLKDWTQILYQFGLGMAAIKVLRQ